MQVSGKVAVITGGARGIGKRIAEVLVDMGASVVIGDVLEQGGQVAEELNNGKDRLAAVFHHCDVSKMDSIKELVDRAESEFGHLDIMVNNAGVGGGFLWIDTDSTTHSSAIDINFKAPVEGTRLAVRSFYAANRPGCVVNIASIVAFTPLEYSPVYSATKAALVAFTAVSAPLAEGTPPVRVNAVAPVYIDTAIVNENVTEKVNGLLRGLGERTVDDVAREVVRCIEDELLAGDTIVMRPEGPGKVATQVPKAESLGFIKHINKQANSSP